MHVFQCVRGFARGGETWLRWGGGNPSVSNPQCVACNIRCVIWADISRYVSLKNVQ